MMEKFSKTSFFYIDNQIYRKNVEIESFPFWKTHFSVSVDKLS